MNNRKNINLNLYKVFYDVAKYGSFSKTAEFTYTTQSAISKSIKKLEEDIFTKNGTNNLEKIDYQKKVKNYYIMQKNHMETY